MPTSSSSRQSGAAASVIVEGVSKEYRLGQLHRSGMLREALVNMVKHPFRRKKAEAESIWALKDVSFSVGEGEVMGIIGRNGAGKSTLLKILSKITHPTSGTIDVRGRIASLLEVGAGFHEELTGRENIYLNGSILGMKSREIDEKLDAIVEFAGVGRFLDTPIKRYSSGMRLRLGFAVAAHLDPDVLLVDEVLAVGDAEFQRRCMKTMDDLRTGRRTVLFVSHSMAAVEHLCPRAVWIDQGRLRRDGPAKQVIAEYLASFGSVENGALNLESGPPREGSGKARFTGVEFLHADGTPRQLIRSGDALTLRLSYRVKEQVDHPIFGVKIHTELGTMLANINTWATGHPITCLEPGEGCLDLHIDFLNLMPGRYCVSLWLSSPGPVPHDRLHHCLTFDVEASDYYGSGKGIDPSLGLVFFPCSWTMHGNSLVGSSE